MCPTEITDQVLYHYVPIVDKAILEQIPMETDHAFSRKFERKMDRMIRRERYGMFYRSGTNYRIMRIAKKAAILLLAVLLLGIVLSFGVEAFRDKFFQVIKSYDGIGKFWNTVYVDVEESGTFGLKEPQYIPDGFVLVDAYEGERIRDWTYEGPDGEYILVENRKIGEGMTESRDAEYDEEETVAIQGVDATLLTRYGEWGYRDLIWYEKDMRYTVYASIDVPVEELIRIAEEMK